MVRAESLPQRGCRSGYMEHRRPTGARQRGFGRLREPVTSATTATAASSDWGSWTTPDAIVASGKAGPPAKQTGG